MASFLTALAVLVIGYVAYGALAEKVFGIDPQRPTPAIANAGGVDFIPMPTWKVFLIQFLNIAGLGPIFGAIMGIMFGPAAFLWIVLGTIFAGAVHDFTSAMISVRSGAKSLPEIVGTELGGTVKTVMRIFSVVLLILVSAVFVLTPADIIAGMTSESLDVRFWIFHNLRILHPCDPAAHRQEAYRQPLPNIRVCPAVHGRRDHGHAPFRGRRHSGRFSDGLYTRYADADTHPVFPMMFVSIACGAISGFHATQSPMMARCLKNEARQASYFYGAMVAEGFVA